MTNSLKLSRHLHDIRDRATTLELANLGMEIAEARIAENACGGEHKPIMWVPDIDLLRLDGKVLQVNAYPFQMKYTTPLYELPPAPKEQSHE